MPDVCRLGPISLFRCVPLYGAQILILRRVLARYRYHSARLEIFHSYMACYGQYVRVCLWQNAGWMAETGIL